MPDVTRTRSYLQNSSVEFDSTLDWTNQISDVTNFSLSDWTIFQCRIKFYAGIFIGSAPVVNVINDFLSEVLTVGIPTKV